MHDPTQAMLRYSQLVGDPDLELIGRIAATEDALRVLLRDLPANLEPVEQFQVTLQNLGNRQTSGEADTDIPFRKGYVAQLKVIENLAR